MHRRLFVLCLCAPLLGLLGVVAAEIVPDGRIGYHLLRAEDEVIVGSVERSPSPLGTTTDHYECVAITTGLGDRPGSNLFERAMDSPSYFGCEQMVDKLEVLRETGELSAGWSYLRTGTAMPWSRGRRSGSSGWREPVGWGSGSWRLPLLAWPGPCGGTSAPASWPYCWHPRC